MADSLDGDLGAQALVAVVGLQVGPSVVNVPLQKSRGRKLFPKPFAVPDLWKSKAVVFKKYYLILMMLGMHN